MKFAELLNYLLEHKYLVVLKGQPHITTKFVQEFQEEELPKPNKEVKVVLPTKAYTEEQKKTIWRSFVAAAGIPHRVPSANGTYTVNQFKLEAANCLIRMIRDLTQDDYKALIEATKSYYFTVSYPMTLGRYLLEDQWVMEVEQFKKNKLKPKVTGGNPFED